MSVCVFASDVCLCVCVSMCSLSASVSFFFWGAHPFLSGHGTSLCLVSHLSTILSYICSPGLSNLIRAHTGAGTQGRHGTGLDKNTRQNGNMQPPLCTSEIMNDTVCIINSPRLARTTTRRSRTLRVHRCSQRTCQPGLSSSSSTTRKSKSWQIR